MNRFYPFIDPYVIFLELRPLGQKLPVIPYLAC